MLFTASYQHTTTCLLELATANLLPERREQGERLLIGSIAASIRDVGAPSGDHLTAKAARLICRITTVGLQTPAASTDQTKAFLSWAQVTMRFVTGCQSIPQTRRSCCGLGWDSQLRAASSPHTQPTSLST